MSSENSTRLQKREEEFHKLNKQLEDRTAKLVDEANYVMRQQESFFQQPISNYDASALSVELPPIKSTVFDDGCLLSVAADGLQDDIYEEDSHRKSHAESPAQRVEPAGDDLIVDNVLAVAANEMGSEAQIRFLKAKLRVLEEQNGDMSKQINKLLDEKRADKSSIKEANDDIERMNKNLKQQQAQNKKWKSAFESEKANLERKSGQLQNAMKELEKQKRDISQSTIAYNTLEVRFNRTLEDLGKIKSQLQKQQHSGRQALEKDHEKVEQLKTENKNLARVNNDSLTVIKKQQKLIGLLKRQVLHVEAAKLLSFTEDEFLKSLSWGKN